LKQRKRLRPFALPIIQTQILSPIQGLFNFISQKGFLMRTFTEGFICRVVRTDWDDEQYPDLELVEDIDEGSCTRWCNGHTVVFRFEGKYYRFFYLRSGTETSWGSGTFEGNIDPDSEAPWTDGIEEVVKKTILVDTWVAVDES